MPLLLASGCASMRSYDTELTDTLSQAADGRIDSAIRTLNANSKRDQRDLLYYLELGELLRLKTDYADSQTAWLSADQRVQEWESAAKADPARMAGAAASYLINDKLRPYEGHDYEKVMLTTRMAMNHLALGEWENARVAIKRTHEREAVIADLRAKEYEEVRQEAAKRGYVPGFKDLNGYPVQEIDNPEVNSLRNSYQSAVSHYLAGFVYEALGEPSLAAPGYRQAIELKPGVPLLEQGLAGLDQRMSGHSDGLTDTLFVIETGLAPARHSQQFSLPIPINDRWILVSVAYPVMRSEGGFISPGAISVDGTSSLTPVQVTSLDALARRALKDEMPGIMLRSAIRATGRAFAQYQAQREASARRHKGNNAAAGLLDLTAFALAVGTMVTESADERGWRSLPAQVFIARGRLPPGRHQLTLDTPFGPRSTQVNISGSHAFVGLRLLRGTLFAMPSGAPPPTGATAADSPTNPEEFVK